MNLSLLDPFNHKFPEVVTQKLGEGGQYLFSQFSPSGSYLLCGGNDGCCYILDTTTYGVVRVLDHPGGTVTCMSMTKDNRFVITGSDANTIKIWDVLDLKELFSYQCPSAVTSVCVNLLNGKQYAAAFSKDSPIFINFDKGFDNPPTIEQILVSDRDAKSKSLLKNSGSYTSIAIDPTSSYVLCGTLKGNLFLYQISNPQVVLTKKVASSPITQIVFHPNSREFLLNCRVSIHLFNFQTSPLSIKELNKFTDQIDKLNWSQCGFDHTGDYVVGGISSLAEHILHVWLKSSGTLEKFLEGPKEGLRHFTWHPTLPNVISTTAVGNTYFWEPTYPQLWSAFAPKFIELEENVEYMEKEDEFDVIIQDQNQKSLANSKAIEGEDDIIDIESVNHLLYNAHGQDVEEVLLDVQLESDIRCPQPLKISNGPKVRKLSTTDFQDDKKTLDSPTIKEPSIPKVQSPQQLESSQNKLDKEQAKYRAQTSSPSHVKKEVLPQSTQLQSELLRRKSSPTVSSPAQNRFSSSNSSNLNEAPKTPIQKHKSLPIETSPKRVKSEISKTPEKISSSHVSSASRKPSTPERFKPSSQLRSSPLKPSPTKQKAHTIHTSQLKSSPNASPRASEAKPKQKLEESDEEGELHSNDELSPPSSQSRGYGPMQHHSSRPRSHSNLQHSMPPHPQQHHNVHYGMRPPNSQPFWYGHTGHPGYAPHQHHQPPHMPSSRPREAINLFGGFYPQKGHSSRPSDPKYRASPSKHDGDRRNSREKAQDSEVEEGEISE